MRPHIVRTCISRIKTQYSFLSVHSYQNPDDIEAQHLAIVSAIDTSVSPRVSLQFLWKGETVFAQSRTDCEEDISIKRRRDFTHVAY